MAWIEAGKLKEAIAELIGREGGSEEAIFDEVITPYVEGLIDFVDNMIEIDPDLSEKEILLYGARRIVEYMRALAASIRVFDPEMEVMVSYGSYGLDDSRREKVIPFEDTIAGKVVRENRSYIVSDIINDPLYSNKEHPEELGLRSMIAVPLRIPRFVEPGDSIEGVIQLYFPEAPREFNRLEVLSAALLARRISHVLAKKRIIELQRLNEVKARIQDKIFTKISKQEGIKLKDVFTTMIPELADIIKIQSCSLFLVDEDEETVHLVAGFPGRDSYHHVGAKFLIEDYHYMAALIHDTEEHGFFEHESIQDEYILVKDPQRSRLVDSKMRAFSQNNGIHSILLVPLRVGPFFRHFLVFDALDQYPEFTQADLEIFTSLGKELIQAVEIEKLDDILHDFQNPAIATAGFARRLGRYCDQGLYEENRDKMHEALDIIIEETGRLQELALSRFAMGDAERVDIGERLDRRFKINEEVVQELNLSHVKMVRGRIEEGLSVRCNLLHIQRVLDNLLNNATKAIPRTGGTLSVSCTRVEGSALIEISNTGAFPEELLKKVDRGKGRGRGLNITRQLVRFMGGEMKIDRFPDSTTFLITLPLARP